MLDVAECPKGTERRALCICANATIGIQLGQAATHGGIGVHTGPLENKNLRTTGYRRKQAHG